MVHDLIIVGGGPAGVAAGIYAARKKLKGILISDSVGGQAVVSAEIQNFIGIKSISGLNLAKTLKDQLEFQKNIKIIEGDSVTEIKKNKAGFKIFTKERKNFDTKTILIVSGSRRKKINIPGEKEFEGRGVFYCSICDAPLMRNKTVAVIGGGNSGFEAVSDLLAYASKIYLLEYTDVLSADLITKEKVKKSKKVEIITMAEAREIFGGEFVKGLEYKDRRNGKIKKLNLQGVFVSVGYQPNSEIAKNLVKLNKNNEIIIDPKTQETSCKGIWAAGDVTDGLYRQVNIAIGDAIKAALNIDSYLYALSMKRFLKKK
ncbi:MAG: FAD-dependent oxidoreductase [bacterium]|nr:FAD-dependent oxidoreductase [bacterium]